MSKKFTKVVAILVVVGVITLLAIRLFFSSTNSLSYKIFVEETDGYYFHKMLGLIPASYQDRYTENLLESFDGGEVLNLVDQKGASHPNFILIRKVNSEVKFLKAYPFKLVGTNKTLGKSDWHKHVSSLIDLNVFNEYLHRNNLRSKADIVEKYCYFLSNPADSTSYKVLKDSIAVNALIKKKPLNNIDYLRGAGYELINKYNIDFEKNDQTVIYCWLYNKGVVKFTFTFNSDNTVKSIDSDIVGFLGNEAPSM